MTDDFLTRLDRIESLLSELLEQRTAKEFNSTAEVARIAGRSDYTVREWCRRGQVGGGKAPNGQRIRAYFYSCVSETSF